MKNHKHFLLRRTGVIMFLFLNCLFVATPFMQSFAENSLSTILHSKSLNSNFCSNQDENTRVPNSSETQQDDNIVSRHQRRSIGNHSQIASSTIRLNTLVINDSQPVFTLNYQSVSLRPFYYCFLFHYQLF